MDTEKQVVTAIPQFEDGLVLHEIAMPFNMTIFGGAGDLSKRKLLPALYHLFLDGRLPESFTLIGIGRTEYSDEAYRHLVAEALREFASDWFREAQACDFLAHCFYQTGDTASDDLYKALCGRIDDLSEDEEANILFYLSVPPGILSEIVTGLYKFQLCGDWKGSKIIVEKPFGRDLSSARDLNEKIRKAFDEDRIYRIDHYLGKETVQNILFFRFGNSLFEPLWDRRYIDHVQIMVAEDMGIGHRGNFYEQAGIVRDIVQNHLLQLLALVAMEPPSGFEGNLIRDEKVKVYRTIRSISEHEMDRVLVRGQYGPGRMSGEAAPGYRQEKHVNSNSNTPTYFAAKLFLDNWRWADVPFYLRTGKRMPKRMTEIFIQFKQPPLKLFGHGSLPPMPNSLVFSIQPEEAISLRMNAKYPGMGNQPHPVEMLLNYPQAFKVKARDAYERLILDAIKGDLTLFARQDGIEAMWAVVDPIIRRWEAHPAEGFPDYSAGSWGPASAAALIARDGRAWHQ